MVVALFVFCSGKQQQLPAYGLQKYRFLIIFVRIMTKNIQS